jgi:hypothetical protein
MSRFTVRITNDTLAGRHYVEDLTGEADPDDLPADGFTDSTEAENAAMDLLVLVGGDVEFVG